MNFAQLCAIASCVRYKPGWRLLIQEEGYGTPTPRHYLRWEFPARCTKTKRKAVIAGRKWRLSEYMTESEVVQTALLAALTCEEHESREIFKYKGKRVFNPHIDVNALLQVCEQEQVRGDTSHD